jgi:hypothetical protein
MAEEAGVEQGFNIYIYQLVTIIFDWIFFSVPAPVPKISFGTGHPTHALFLPIITKPLLSQSSISPVHVNNIAAKPFRLKPSRPLVFYCDY